MKMYGGTKTEMQRLLADAQKITGVKYDINNLSDVYSAIHAIQGKLNITGTTQREAMTTLSGSFNMLKASWQDFLGNMALGQKLDFKPLLTSINAVIFGSGGIIYMAGNIGKALMDALKNLPNALNSIGPMIANLFSSSNLSALQINIATVINEIISSFVSIGGKITNAFAANFPSMLSNILTFLQQMGNYLSAQAPYLISKGFEMLNNLVNGIINAIPVLIQKLPQIITTFANIINDNAPTIVTKGFELVGKLVMGIIKAIPLVIQNIPQILKAIWSVFTAFQWLNLGKTVMSALGNGIKAMKGSIGNAAKNIGETIINFIKSIPGRLISLGRSMINGLKNAISGGAGGVRSVMSRIGQVIVNSLKAIPGQLSNIGVNLVKGLWNGIGNMTGWIKSKISGFGKSVVNGLKSFFHIHSPSTLMRDEIGIYLGQGIGIGIEDSAGFVNKKASLLGAGIIENAQSQLNGGLKLDDVYSKVTASYQMSNHDTASQSRLDRIIRLLELLLGKNTDIYIDKEKVIKMIDKELGELAYE